jgi:arginine decarboxylase
MYKGTMHVRHKVAAEEEPKFEFYTSRLGIRYSDIIPFTNRKLKETVNLFLRCCISL